MRTNLNDFKHAIVKDGEVLALFVNEADAATASKAMPDSKVDSNFYTDMSSTYYVEFSAEEDY